MPQQPDTLSWAFNHHGKQWSTWSHEHHRVDYQSAPAGRVNVYPEGRGVCVCVCVCVCMYSNNVRSSQVFVFTQKPHPCDWKVSVVEKSPSSGTSNVMCSTRPKEGTESMPPWAICMGRLHAIG